MKLSSSPMRIALAGATAVVLLAVGSPETGQAATTAPALSPQVVLRPLTPTEKTQYGLSALQGANGLNAIGVGQPAYVEALVSSAIPASNILSVTWSLTKPTASTATLSDTPLGTNVPTYKMMDRLECQIVGRTFLRPDITGQYSVTATIVTDTGTTNVTKNISSATYMGDNVCQLCHSGGAIAQSIYPTWSNTHHATFFTRSINGQSGTYRSTCVSCHTVGYDVNTNAVNGGFDDVAKSVGWTFPTNLAAGIPTNLAAGNWAAMPNELKNLANIQCENCHGPGSEHAYAFGNTNLSNWPRIDVNFSAGNCGQCHDAMSHHFKNAEWNNSKHAIATSEPTGPGEEGCVRCHSGIGYMNFVDGSVTNTAYEAINCTTCHDPHDAANPHQLRTKTSVALMDKKTTVGFAQAGNGIVCMNCHISRRDATNYVEVTAGSSRFGPHHGPQTDMLLGVNAMAYGKSIPSSAHRDVVEDSCVTCHMQEIETGPAFTHAGGHTFNMAWAGDATNAPVHMTEACVECHGPTESFDFARQDYDGNGVVDGVQTEVRGLLTRLTKLLPCGEIAPANHTASSLGITSSWKRPELRAAFNYLFVVEDGSFGVHNLSYAVGLLKASIIDLNGDLNNDGLPDKWQIQYFGSTSAANAAPNASVTGDGIPNWAKYNLGLDPTVAGAVFPGGVVWASGSKLFNSADTNAIQIYTAAEVAFNTEAGQTYQIQGISSLGGGWQNVGTPIPGTGQTISYVTPTRPNAQQFYRVITVTP